jgi:malate dehydrogenase (oxaloacetate-decarboxylating)(NADP+)
MCFPYIFRGALDVQAKTINIEMKIAAAHAIANLARKDITEEVFAASTNRIEKFGPNYIIPITFDSRLIEEVSSAVAKAAMESGVATKPIIDFHEYRRKLAGRLNPVMNISSGFFSKLKSDPKKVIFTAGEEPAMVKAAMQWCYDGYGEAVLIGNQHKIAAMCEKVGEMPENKLTIIDPDISTSERYADYMYRKMQRNGMTRQECFNKIRFNKTLFAASMLAHDEADAIVDGDTQLRLPAPSVVIT